MYLIKKTTTTIKKCPSLYIFTKIIITVINIRNFYFRLEDVVGTRSSARLPHAAHSEHGT